MRASNRAALVVMVNNFKEKTSVTSVATGSSRGMIFNFDWGAADSFSEDIRRLLEKYIIQ